jgi:hypothetical protein
MECWFRIKNRLAKVEHAKVTSRLLNWMLDIDKSRMHRWIIESED